VLDVSDVAAAPKSTASLKIGAAVSIAVCCLNFKELDELEMVKSPLAWLPAFPGRYLTNMDKDRFSLALTTSFKAY
jgi:hypothetical protein